MLDKRLTKIAEFVSGKGIAADIGTDHAYLAAELIKSGRCRKVIASDIKEGPLESARSTVEKNGIADRVELILSDGLKNVPLTGVTDVVIAGMGGETIADIIGAADAAKRGYEDIRWILQPMTKSEILRKKLFEYGIAITDEYAVEDGDKLYVIMVAEYSPYFRSLTETESLYGFFDEDDEDGKKYRRREAERLSKIAAALESAGKSDEALHFEALSAKLAEGTETVFIDELIAFLDTEYPFSLQEKWDNSGYLVESRLSECSKVILSLDITNEAVKEADSKGAELIISHHPVIFSPIKNIRRTDTVYRLIESGIGAVCMHTNADIARGGTNGVILKKLSENLELSCQPEPFEELSDGNSLGWIITLSEPLEAGRLAEMCKKIFGCEYIRMSRCNNNISKIAFCSGSGGSMLGIAAAKNCDAYITGDVKHDVWIDAANLDITLLDCGHFHTENLVLWELRRMLEERFPLLDIEIAESSVDPCEYV